MYNRKSSNYPPSRNNNPVNTYNFTCQEKKRRKITRRRGEAIMRNFTVYVRIRSARDLQRQIDTTAGRFHAGQPLKNLGSPPRNQHDLARITQRSKYTRADPMFRWRGSGLNANTPLARPTQQRNFDGQWHFMTALFFF